MSAGRGVNAYLLDASGNPIVSTSGAIAVTSSGGPVTISGNTVRIADSGSNMVGSNNPNADGYAATVTNKGLNSVAFNLGYNDTDGNWKRLRTDQSGALHVIASGDVHQIAGAGGSIVTSFSPTTDGASPATNVGLVANAVQYVFNGSSLERVRSGRSGQGIVAMTNSGSFVTIAAVNGNAGDIFGVLPQTDANVPGNFRGLASVNFNLVYDPTGNVWNRLRADQSGYVQTISKAATTTSGRITGISGLLVDRSGNSVTRVQSVSGGIGLSSGAAYTVAIKTPNANSGQIFMGYQWNVPASGVGYMLAPGDTTTITTSNLGNLYFFAQVSGDIVSVISTLQ